MKENSKTKNVIITTAAEINRKNKEFWYPDRKNKVDYWNQSSTDVGRDPLQKGKSKGAIDLAKLAVEETLRYMLEKGKDTQGAFGSIPSPPEVQFLLPKDKIMSPEDFTDNFTLESFRKAKAKSIASRKDRKNEDEIPPLTRPKRKFSI